jgi:hypothetical protein
MTTPNSQRPAPKAPGGHIVLGIALVCVLVPANVHGDGGIVQGQRTVGSWLVTLFTTTRPVAGQPVDLSVLVQDRASQDVLLDADVTAICHPASADGPIVATLTQEQATNRLLYAARVTFPTAGEWGVQLSVHRQGVAAQLVVVPLDVATARSPVVTIWPWIVAPPVVVALFMLHQAARQSLVRPRARQPSAV